LHHKEKDAEKQAEETKDNGQDKMTTGAATTTTGTATAADAGEDLFGKGIVGRTPTDIKEIPAAPGTVSGPGEGNTTRPIPGSPAPAGNVTISNGVTNFEMPNSPQGVFAYSNSAGTVTVTNGTISKTFSGGSVTVSGASNILRGDNIEVGGANGEGKTVIVANLPPPVSKPMPIPPQGGVTGTGVVDEIKGIGGQAVEIGKQLGQIPCGVKEGFTGDTRPCGPTPPPETSTSTQQ
jgi:hypothetical protein